MFETVGVLVIFFILLAIGISFYFGIQQSTLQKERIQAGQQHALQVVLKSLYLPELDCSLLGTQRENCIDIIKLQEFSELLRLSDAQNHYFGEFGYSTILIHEIYPNNTTTQLYTKPADTYTQRIKSQQPILLYSSRTKTYAFGVIEVDTYV